MRILTSLRGNKLIQNLILVGMVLVAVVSLLQGVKNAIAVSQDFQWDAARALMERMDPYELSLDQSVDITGSKLEEFYDLFERDGIKQKMEANQFPSLLMLLFPYALLSPFAARLAWIISNVFFTAGIIWLLRRTFLKELPHFDFAFLMLLMIIGTPYRNQLGVGQHTLFSFFFFMLAVWLDEIKPEGNRIAIAVCMFISYFKYTLTAPLTLYLLYRKRFKEFAASVLGHMLLTVVAAVWMKKSPVYMIMAPLKVANALSAEGGLDLGAVFGGGVLSLVAGGIVALFLIFVTVKLPKGQENLLISLLILWSLIITYHRTYDFFVLSVVVAAFIGSDVGFGKVINTDFMKIFYGIVLFAVYFVLRMFNENTLSRIGVGIIYYIFTIMISIIVVNLICGKQGIVNEG